MNKILPLFLTIFLLSQSVNSNAQGYFWVSFTDKNDTNFSLSTPEQYLSERAIERRIKQNIPIDSLDLPVNRNYIDSVISIGATFIHSSKWLNGITVYSELDSFETEVLKFLFVNEVQRTKSSQITKSAVDKFHETESLEKAPIDTALYGASVYQTGLMNGQFLHNQGFNGEGMQIAVLDAGFYNADIYEAFDSMWVNNQVLGTKDFVDSDADFFQTHYHGMSVLSCMVGNVPGELIGTGRKASYWLLRTEDAGSENMIEEDNWVAAAEFADSAGVDIINSSLGYYEFDDPTVDHTYADMDGKTTRVTRGANIAVTRGILVFSSLGNEGNNRWKYLIAPSDGDNVIGVGATNKFGFVAPFTSYGPNSDGEIKPNVVGVGWNTFLQLSSGNLGYANGTSFSSPVMAGMAACLWQAAPNATATEVKLALEMSASKYENPDSLMGYGIPDFQKAWIYLVNQTAPEQMINNKWFVYPNPIKDILVIQKNDFSGSEEINIEIYTLEGRLIKSWRKPNLKKIFLTDIADLPHGILLLRLSSDQNTQTIKLNKIF